MGSESLHEPREVLSVETIDAHRGFTSLIEELEAIDWYNQRVEATVDSELAGILRHNRDEEKEHAAMVLEWLRRRDPRIDAVLRQYLFSEGPILEIEETSTESVFGGTGSGPARSLGIGGLKDKELL